MAKDDILLGLSIVLSSVAIYMIAEKRKNKTVSESTSNAMGRRGVRQSTKTCACHGTWIQCNSAKRCDDENCCPSKATARRRTTGIRHGFTGNGKPSNAPSVLYTERLVR
jgi:hypothetical protein